ncbi:MAG: hypothetical protein OEM02_10555 [Desulfobulbaceae bacterium]|nr:hypothetical protein [Desulfobulbaceae bacterium]
MIDYEDIEYINKKMFILHTVWGIGIICIFSFSIAGFFLFDTYSRSMDFSILASLEHYDPLHLFGYLTLLITIQFIMRAISLKPKCTDQAAKTAFSKYLFLTSASSAIALIITIISVLNLLFTKNFIFFSVINLIAVELLILNFPKQQDVIRLVIKSIELCKQRKDD